MKKRISFWITFMMLAGCLLSGCDNPPVPGKKFFLKYYGQEGSQTCVDLEIDPVDGSFYMLGTTGAKVDDPTASLFLVKADQEGNLIKKITIDGNGLGLEAKDLELSSMGGVVVLANSMTSNGNHDIFIARYDAGLSEIDHYTFDAKNQNDEEKGQDDNANTITEIKDNNGIGYIVAGSSFDLAPVQHSTHPVDGLHMRLTDSLGFLVQKSVYVWTDVSGIGPKNYEVRVVQLDDTTFYSFGYSNGVTGSDDDTVRYRAVRISDKGTPTSVLDLGEALTDKGKQLLLGDVALQGTPGPGAAYYLAGIAIEPGINTSSSIFVSSLIQTVDANQSPILIPNSLSAQSPYELSSPTVTKVSIAMSRFGGYFILTNESSRTTNNWLLMKSNSDGTKAWDAPISFGGDGDDVCGAVRELSDGRILISGTFFIAGEKKMVLMKLNSNGHLAN